MENLRLGTAEVTTQIVQRDRHAELVCALANLASSIDKFSTEIRNLQRTEIDEAREPLISSLRSVALRCSQDESKDL